MVLRKKLGIGFLVIILALLTPYYIIFNVLPGSFSLIEGNESIIRINFPFDLYISSSNSHLSINGKNTANNYIKLNSDLPLKVSGQNVGRANLRFKLFGIIPIKSITVNVLPDVNVYPGGQAIGVLLRSKGVMVVGNSYVEDKNGERFYPAQKAGIEVGDRIIKIEDQIINDKMELASKIQKISRKGLPVSLLIKDKKGNIKNVKIKAIKNKQGIYMIGLYVDDGVAGVGTLTFYEPENNEFGALGHEITETNSQTRIEVREGKIIKAQISGINSGKSGLPGEKLGTFFQTDEIIGDIRINNNYGIYGKLKKKIVNPYFKKPIPVAPIDTVKKGAAHMYTVVKGGKIEEFDIYIERVYHQSSPHEKGMIINITDPDLTDVTGGIIQGMSGSPIVQDNKLVGAITHVFVNEPTKGYGIFAEWMLLQTEMYNMSRANNY